MESSSPARKVCSRELNALVGAVGTFRVSHRTKLLDFNRDGKWESMASLSAYNSKFSQQYMVSFDMLAFQVSKWTFQIGFFKPTQKIFPPYKFF